MPAITLRLLTPLFLTIGLSQGFAHSYGPPPRVTGGPGDNPRACTLCHSTSALNSFSGSVSVILQSGPVYIPGVKQRVMVRVADLDQQRWGFELSARLNSDPQNGQAGDLNPVDNLTQVICEDAGTKPCATGIQFIEHTSFGTRNGTKQGATFQFDWTPPATDVGPITFYFAGNAANGDGGSTGDHIYTSSIQLDPLKISAPAVATGNIVSAATNAAGPVAANSWITIYGSNLAATTRTWTESDFTNGAFPTSLDGVSVVLTAFGAPRLAYIGYVSPTQLNVLLPSDTNSTTVQVQVKNPAGITPQMPITVQANAPQMLSIDGTYVWGAHADGSLVSKSSPVAPGEMITVYGTGCGPTNPALTPGQMPTQANALTTLPKVTIGGAAANVVAASVVPGTGGVYQIRMEIPSDATNGDQPVVAQLGTANSAPFLLTVLK